MLNSMILNKQKFLDDGYLILPGYYNISQEQIDISNSLMTDYGYKIGRKYVSNNPAELPNELKQLICTKEIKDFFDYISGTDLACRDVMLTHEFKHDIMERNKWLHFDRWRTLKAMVYLTDVVDGCGPFSVVPKTHKKAAPIRRKFKNLPYENRLNRIELDYPELMQEPIGLFGKAGTLILFDSDVFHLGGNISEGNERKLIRSHWYTNNHWRENS